MRRTEQSISKEAQLRKQVQREINIEEILLVSPVGQA